MIFVSIFERFRIESRFPFFFFTHTVLFTGFDVHDGVIFIVHVHVYSTNSYVDREHRWSTPRPL